MLRVNETTLYNLLRPAAQFQRLIPQAQIDAAQANLRELQRHLKMRTNLAPPPAMKDMPIKVFQQDWDDLQAAACHLQANGYPELSATGLVRVALHLMLDELASNHLVGEGVELSRAARLVAAKAKALHPEEQTMVRDAMRKLL